MTTIAIINESTVVGDDQISGSVLDAMRTQLTRDFCGPWNVDISRLIFAPKGAGGSLPTLDSTTWVMAILDDSDQADALGYHDQTGNGTPLGKVFAKTCIADQESWTVCLSHELLEMIVDPSINLCAEGPDGRIRALEVCDAVEDDSLGYDIGGILVSDFVLPSWFSMAPTPLAPFDYQKKCTQAFQLLVGGYISVMQAGDWSQVNADSKAMRKRPAQKGSRRERRRRLHAQRLKLASLGMGELT